MAEEKDIIRLEVVTPELVVFHQMVESFYVPTQMGSIGVLANHAPLVTALVPGLMRLRREGREQQLVVGEGFLEMRDNEAEILVHNAELVEDIDVDRAQQAKQRALQRLREKRDDLDIIRAQAALARANARLKAKGL